jgi:hypothetical protein
MKGLGYAMAVQDRPEGVSGRARRYKPSDKDYKLSSINISPADNGFVVECRHEPIREKNGPDIPYREPAKMVFADAASLIKAIPKMLGHKMSDHKD